MNCPECQDVLQRRLDGEPVPRSAALDAHLAECAECRERHAAARRLLDGLRRLPAAGAPADLTRRILAGVERDRAERRRRARRGLAVTLALAASILLMAAAGYVWLPRPAANDGPVASIPKPPDERKAPAPREPLPDGTRTAIASLTGKLADRTLDQARVLLTAVPVDELPAVPELDPAAQTLRQTGQDVSGGLQTVTRSARRALDYFAREMPMLDLPEAAQGPAPVPSSWR